MAEQIFSASEQVKNAVNMVNQAVKNTDNKLRERSSNQKRSRERDRSANKNVDQLQVPGRFQINKKPDNQNLIEESLDSFDFFKVTNLGRINNELGSQSQQRGVVGKPNGESVNKRAKWGAAAAGSSELGNNNISKNLSKDQ